MTRHDLPHEAAQLALALHPIGTACTDAAAHLAYIRELLPLRGELVEEFEALTAIIAWIHNAYRDADERLTQVAVEIQHAEDVPEPLPLGAQTHPLRLIEGGR